MLIYDIEIHRAVPDRQGRREPDIEYCEGWHDHKGMGIAVVCVYDYQTDRYRVFCEDNLVEFKMLVHFSECIVGFNNHRFDDLILAAHDVPIPLDKSYDIFEEICRSLDSNPATRGQYHAGYALDNMCQANFGTSKQSNGAVAPVQWQRGQIGTVIDYCLNDIHLTKRLLGKIIRTGQLADPNTGTQISIRKPGAYFR